MKRQETESETKKKQKLKMINDRPEHKATQKCQKHSEPGEELNRTRLHGANCLLTHDATGMNHVPFSRTIRLVIFLFRWRASDL